MKFIGTLTTEGAPVCIAPVAEAREWDGLDGDYWDMMEDEPNGLITTFVNRLGVRYAFFHTESGHFALFAAPREVVLFELVREDGSVPGERDLEAADFDLARMAIQPEVLTLGGLGGPIALFDAVLSGTELNLDEEGCARANRFPEYRPDVPDTAIIDVEFGVWTVSYFAYEDDESQVRGAWFQNTSVTEQPE